MNIRTLTAPQQQRWQRIITCLKEIKKLNAKQRDLKKRIVNLKTSIYREQNMQKQTKWREKKNQITHLSHSFCDN